MKHKIPENVSTETGRDVEGWYALYHPKQHYWLGDLKGTICYKDHYFARMARTVLWQMRATDKVLFTIRKFTAKNLVEAGTVEFEKAAEKAIRDYEQEAV